MEGWKGGRMEGGQHKEFESEPAWAWVGDWVGCSLQVGRWWVVGGFDSGGREGKSVLVQGFRAGVVLQGKGKGKDCRW